MILEPLLKFLIGTDLPKMTKACVSRGPRIALVFERGEVLFKRGCI